MKAINKKTYWIAGLVIAVLIGGAYFYKQKKPKAEPSAAQANPALTVTVTQPQSAEWQAQLTADGKIVAWQEASLSAQGAGLKVNNVLVEVGDSVRKGQTLITFEGTTAQADIHQLNANLKEAQANLADAQFNVSKADSLRRAGAISDQQYRQLKTAQVSAKARLEAAQSAKAAAQERATLTAPQAGVISARNATVGAVVQPGQELFRLVVNNRLEWHAELSPDQVSQLSVGDQATLHLPNDVTITGQVRQIAPTLNSTNNTVTVYVSLPETQTARVGQYVQGSFAAAQAKTALTLPQTAVSLRDGFYYVFKVNSEHKVQQVKVTLGGRQGERAVIESGINADDQVVMSGTDFLNDGDLVAVTTNTPAAQ